MNKNGRPEVEPQSEIYRHRSIGYQVMKETWGNGEIRFYLKVGHFVENRGGGYISPKIYSGTEEQAKEALEKAKLLVRTVEARYGRGTGASEPAPALVLEEPANQHLPLSLVESDSEAA